MAEFRMPSLGADMERGTVTEWRVAPGDTVHRGDIVAVVDTEKSDIEVEIFTDGVIEELVVPVGQEVEVGAVLAIVAPVAAEAPAGPRRPVSPFARRLARERGIDLAALHGSGPAGAVVAADVPPQSVNQPTVTPPPPAPADDVARAAVGALMARSAREIPQYHLGLLVDLSDSLRWLDERNRGSAVADRVLPIALVLRAAALAVAHVPEVNGWWRDGRFERATRVDLGVAVARRGGGLVAPMIPGAEALPLPELMRALAELVARAKAGRLRPSEMGAPSLTVTNLGDAGADSVRPLIYPPQVAMLGVGRITERPWAEGGMVGARPTVHLSLAADHRVTNGHEGSRYLRAVERLLDQPEEM